MKLIEVSKEEFKNLADKSEQITFHQTMEWANLKSVNGWKHFYVSLDDDGKSCGCALLLAKKIPLFPAVFFSFSPPFSPFSKHQVKNFPIIFLSFPHSNTFLAMNKIIGTGCIFAISG